MLPFCNLNVTFWEKTTSLAALGLQSTIEFMLPLLPFSDGHQFFLFKHKNSQI